MSVNNIRFLCCNDSDKTVVLNLKGGLGNQLIQLLAVYTYAEQKALKKIYIFKWNLKFYSPPRFFGLTGFINNAEIEIIQLRKKWFMLFNPLFLMLLHKLDIFIVNERTFSSGKNNYILDGYFQSNEYISNGSVQILKRSITSMQNILIEKNFISDNCSFENSIGFHFRFTDRYSADGVKKYRNLLGLFDFSEFERIYIFSDDYDTVKNLFPQATESVMFVNVLNLSDQEEFILMTLIPYFFISNSTYSIVSRLLSSHNRITYYNSYDFDLNTENLLFLLKNFVNTHTYNVTS